ncbi:MAG TPA: YcfL family protein [Tepidisphaeraceae bacterium]|jgi:uncharacterized protein YcfL|nr:YcfL family protein [Tepidisphaeraceae bacterium]
MLRHTLNVSLLSAVVLIGGFGCKSVNTTERAQPTYEADRIKAKNVVTDGYARDYAKVLDVRQSTVSGDIMKVQVEVRNDNLRPGNLDYKFEWFDESGMIVNSPSSTWQALEILKGETKSLSSVAPNSRAKDFRLKIERRRRN